ncbi:unnamed protein product [Amoebophrya sp. A25]|nr:unnamed protein product [Amoebophrya sp. A25]|eukprot:GSA25T00023653001.1
MYAASNINRTQRGSYNEDGVELNEDDLRDYYGQGEEDAEAQAEAEREEEDAAMLGLQLQTGTGDGVPSRAISTPATFGQEVTRQRSLEGPDGGSGTQLPDQNAGEDNADQEAARPMKRRAKEEEAAIVIQKVWLVWMKWRQEYERAMRDASFFYRITWQANQVFEMRDQSRFARLVNMSMNIFIILSILGFILETEPILRDFAQGWYLLELVCTIVFICEYMGRLVCCFHNRITKFQFVMKGMNIADALAISPFFLEMAFAGGKTKMLKLLRIVRLVRLGKLFKVGKYANGLKLMVTAVTKSASILLVLLMFVIMGVIFFAACGYFFEQLSCPQSGIDFPHGQSAELDQYYADCESRPLYRKDGPMDYKRVNAGYNVNNDFLCCNLFHDGFHPFFFNSISSALWWGLVTLTSVGYGDMFPYTPLGRIAGMAASLGGVLIIAVPLAIVARNLADAYDQENYNAQNRRDPVAEKRLLRKNYIKKKAAGIETTAFSMETPKADANDGGFRWKKYLARLPKSEKLKAWGNQDLPRLFERICFLDSRMNNMQMKMSKLFRDHDTYLDAQAKIVRFSYHKELLLRACVQQMGSDAAERLINYKAAQAEADNLLGEDLSSS